ncbi:MAG TPA: hypothetical protein VIB48_10360 [Acidimicrobiia bacterium]|jgi:hypothetical protein
MGMLKNLRTLMNESKEMRRNLDLAARTRDAQAQMAGLGEAFASQTTAANLASSGEEAHAQVLATRDAGATVPVRIDPRRRETVLFGF